MTQLVILDLEKANCGDMNCVITLVLLFNFIVFKQDTIMLKGYINYFKVIGHANYKKIYRSTNIKMSTHPASKGTSQDGRTSGSRALQVK